MFALWYLALGPRTDVSHMTRRELFESAGGFVTWTLLSVVALQLVLLSAPENGSLWVCVVDDVQSQPSQDAKSWQLAVKRGRDGDDARRDDDTR